MEERVTSLFQPDTLLPEQYLDTFRRKLHLEPEKKLMLAILEDAHRLLSEILLRPRRQRAKRFSVKPKIGYWSERRRDFFL